MRRNWTEQELILAFNLYCKLPFGQISHTNNKIIELAKILERTPSAVSLKLCNFARLDPYHQNRGVKGMPHGSVLDKKIWDEFNHNWEELSYQSEVSLAKLKGIGQHDLVKLEDSIPEGEVKEAIVKVRINQNFFREMILASYNSRCAICSLPEANLLVAGHIVPWSVNAIERMNPRNGICMCVLHEKAFDKGLMTINDDYNLQLSKTIIKISHELAIQRGFISYDNLKIKLPERFIPDKIFLAFHRNNVFIG